MTRPFRILGAGGGGNNSSDASYSPTSTEHDSDYAVILAALLCGLICVVGLLTVFRCACFRSSTSNSPPPLPKAANKGLKKKILRSLPKVTFTPESCSSSSPGNTSTEASDCAICLAEFVGGDEIRVLPQCKHSFHVACIDSWLKSHSTCPSCRGMIVAGDHEVEKSAKERGNRDVADFLP